MSNLLINQIVQQIACICAVFAAIYVKKKDTNKDDHESYECFAYILSKHNNRLFCTCHKSCNMHVCIYYIGSCT